jgi:hypothetical protein
MRIATIAFALVLFAACEGPGGSAGQDGKNGQSGAAGEAGPPGAPGEGGDAGPPGPIGPMGTSGCDGLPADATRGVKATLSVAAPKNGMFFAVGEQVVLTAKLLDSCGRAYAPADLATASLYISGPRKASLTRTAVKLLNCSVDRAAKDRQHHAIYLANPSYTDPAQKNLAIGADGTITYTFAAVSDEEPGTYTIGLWAVSKDQKDQILPTIEVQIGTATREEYTSGPKATSSCYDCHLDAQNGRSYQAHIEPGFAPFGNYALDQAPIENCKLCHNLDGYSPNPIVRKVHGAHRGHAMLAPGAPHPEYGLGADATLAAFVDVEFPSMPGHDLDCAKCHVDDAWRKNPARLACGTCHDNVFFDTGTLNPPRTFGKPNNVACQQDADCAGFGSFATCDHMSGNCLRVTHPPQKDDSMCTTCHTADVGGIAPVPVVHDIAARTQTRSLKIVGLTLAGGTGKNGSFNVGDKPTIQFQIQDRSKNFISDLAANKALSATLMISGPTDHPQRVYASVALKTNGALSYDGGNNLYTWASATGWPANAASPLNTTLPPQANLPGTYTLWLWVNESLTVNGQSVRDAANAEVDFRFGSDGAVQPRQVILQSACDGCHVVTQAHGGSRTDAGTCFTCHTMGAVDRGVGSKGVACTVDAQCAGFAGGWEKCTDTNNDGKPDTCVITADPTPSQMVAFPVMIHQIHFARKLGGYNERANLQNAGKLGVVGFNNSYNDFSDILFPQDIRNCARCHASTGAACSAMAPCGMGQTCTGGKCVNVAWQEPSTVVCTSCHDSGAAYAHAILNTWSGPDGPVETCDVCHGTSGEFAVSKVHDIATTLVPPYTRE